MKLKNKLFYVMLGCSCAFAYGDCEDISLRSKFDHMGAVKVHMEAGCIQMNGKVCKNYIFVSIPDQKLFYFEDGILEKEYTISTAKLGAGCEVGHGTTPFGWHKIAEMFGAGEPEGMVFNLEHKPIDRLYTDCGKYEFCGITSRRMMLQGFEEGVNTGICKHLPDHSCDAGKVGFSIHGTDREDQLGAPASGMCIRMGNADVIELFNCVQSGTIVFISKD